MPVRVSRASECGSWKKQIENTFSNMSIGEFILPASMYMKFLDGHYMWTRIDFFEFDAVLVTS